LFGQGNFDAIPVVAPTALLGFENYNDRAMVIQASIDSGRMEPAWLSVGQQSGRKRRK